MLSATADICKIQGAGSDGYDLTGEFGIKILDDPGIWLKKKTSKPWEQNHHNGQNWLDVHAEQQLWL